MRRAPIVIAATAVGLGGVLAFHTKPVTVAVGSTSGTSGSSGSSGTSGGSGGTSGATANTGAGSGSSKSGSSKSGSSKSGGQGSSRTSGTGTTSPSTGGTRTATGELVNYNYGILSVAATVKGSRITNVRIASINEGGNPLSMSIDQQSIPTLEQETLQAQSANIQSVSGASYTSAGFVQSLQSALSKLGVK